MKMTKLSMAPFIRYYPCCKFVLASNASQINISLSDLIISSVLASFDPYLMKDKKNTNIRKVIVKPYIE
jgi:hypothetical protein